MSTSAGTPARSPILDVRLHGSLGEDVRECLQAKLSAVLTRRAGVADRARVRMSGPDYAAGLVLVQVNLRVCGTPARIQVAAGSVAAAIAAAAARLRRQIRRLTTAWEPCPDPQHPPLAPADHGLIARLKNPWLYFGSPSQAAVVLDAMDYAVYLFTDIETGEDAVVYRAGSAGLRLARQHTMHPPSTPLTRAMTVDPRTFGVHTAAQAARRLADRRLPFVFYTDADTGRGNVLYRRYAGNLGLISPFVTEPIPQPLPARTATPNTAGDHDPAAHSAAMTP